jgi:hypothetical protein
VASAHSNLKQNREEFSGFTEGSSAGSPVWVGVERKPDFIVISERYKIFPFGSIAHCVRKRNVE